MRHLFPHDMPDKNSVKLVLSLCLVLLLTVAACNRRELDYSLEAEIVVRADWSQSGLGEENNYGATLLFYPQEGGDPKVVLMGDRTNAKVRLSKGRYDVVIFNRSFSDFGYIGFRGTGRLSALEAYAKDIVNRGGASATAPDVIVGSPEALASGVVRGFEVTEPMLGNYNKAVAGKRSAGGGADESCNLCFTPRLLTQEVRVKVHVKGLNNVRTATCSLTGIAASVFLADGRRNEATVTQEFILTDPVFAEGSLFDGSLSATINVFGLDAEQARQLHFKAGLVDGQTNYEETVGSVTVSESDDGSGGITLSIEVATSDNIPDVKPEGGSGSGFETKVDEWGDEVDSEIDMSGNK